MNIDLLVVGKTDSAEIQSLVATYLKRLNFYTRVTLVTLPDLKNTRNISAESQKRQEGELLMRQFADGDYVVLLDEKGAEMRSVEFSMWLQKRMNSGVRRLCFVIGGPYGFSKTVYDRADESISLSQMTFSHQIIRAIFAEQLYRAFTIIRNEPYHHE
ncbi:Ribosomal RNA large subunit methyltransferase H [Alistipes sp. cv1]|nr:Ribosomal RNA large subunit methyltransferase H [Faecalibacterium prausnitzii]